MVRAVNSLLRDRRFESQKWAVCMFMSEKTSKLHATLAEDDDGLLLTLSPQLSLALSPCIKQLT